MMVFNEVEKISSPHAVHSLIVPTLPAQLSSDVKLQKHRELDCWGVYETEWVLKKKLLSSFSICISFKEGPRVGNQQFNMSVEPMMNVFLSSACLLHVRLLQWDQGGC